MQNSKQDSSPMSGHNPYVMSKAKPLVTRGCMLAEPLQRPRLVGLQTPGSPCCTPYVVSKAKPQVPTVRALRPWRLARPRHQPQPVGLLARNQSLPSSTSTQMQTMVVYAETQTDEPPAKIAKRLGDESSLRLGGWHWECEWRRSGGSLHWECEWRLLHQNIHIL